MKQIKFEYNTFMENYPNILKADVCTYCAYIYML